MSDQFHKDLMAQFYKKLNKEYYDIKEPVLCARVFEDGSFARCIMFNDTSSNNSLIISLEETFDQNGGLSKFHWYNAGLTDYKYRKLTNSELKDLVKKLSHCDKNVLGVDIWEVINREIKIVRQLKLKKLKDESNKP